MMLLGLLLATARLVGAQETNSQTTAATTPPSKVTAVEGNLELDDIIRVQVDHLSEWAATNDASKLVPYLNGRAIRGNYPVEIHASKNHLHFHLAITPESKNVWVDLLGEPRIRKPVTVSVGLENQSPFDTAFDQSNRLLLTVISPMYGIISLILVLVTLILFLWLAR